ncbi:MAG TPA: AMP-binding protein [Actinomycetota bacterium]|nr:AMP-binding protein [Actinomycetota bacterium]
MLSPQFCSINDALQQRSSSPRGITFVDFDGDRETWTWGKLAEIARSCAGAWLDLGVRPGDRVGLLGSTTPDFVACVFGAWAAGAVAVPLAVPMRLSDPGALVDEVRSRADKARLSALALDPRFAAFPDLLTLGPPTATFEDVRAAGRDVDFAQQQTDDPALIQFTSGSTARPKGVVLSQGCLMRNAESGGRQVDFGPEDVAVSWLPLFHDFGLIGLTLWPLYWDMSAYLIAPEVFISSPKIWIETLSRAGGTITAAPNFAYGLATRVLRNAETTYDLSRLRVAANGAEPVDAKTMEELAAVGARHGLRPEALLPVYGLAEATLGVAAPRPGAARAARWADAEALAEKSVAVEVPAGTPGARPLVSVGYPVLGCEIEIRSETGEKVPDGHVGEVCVRSESAMVGYFEDPEETDKVLQDGWIKTGDLGLWGPDGLVITGRLKDMIIVGGRNLYPEDAERAANNVPGVRRGNAVAFGILERAREGLVVIAETRLHGEEAARLARQVATEVRHAMRVAADQVVLLAPGSLPKTPSGKLQRRLTRRLHETGELLHNAVATAGRALGKTEAAR